LVLIYLKYLATPVKNNAFNCFYKKLVMKTSIKIVIILFLVSLFAGNLLLAQNQTTIEPGKLYLVIKFDGAEFLGTIKSYDAHELLISTENIGDVYVPKHMIKEIREVNPEMYKEFSGEELFATRYFITTNGLPIKKGDNYIQWNLYGPDFQFGIAKNFGVGIMTSWMAIPVIVNAKYSIKLGEKTHMALGALLGTGSWAYPDFGGILPFASFTYGNRKSNLTFSSGYGRIFYSENMYNPRTSTDYKARFNEGRFLFSIAGMLKINNKISLVFDSFISPWGPEKTYTEWIDTTPWDNKDPHEYNWVSKTRTVQSPNLAIILPGIRWQLDPKKAFQFGFTGLYFDGEFVPFPVPMVQWYLKL
jgi:hypothetical protein